MTMCPEESLCFAARKISLFENPLFPAGSRPAVEAAAEAGAAEADTITAAAEPATAAEATDIEQKNKYKKERPHDGMGALYVSEIVS